MPPHTHSCTVPLDEYNGHEGPHTCACGATTQILRADSERAGVLAWREVDGTWSEQAVEAH